MRRHVSAFMILYGKVQDPTKSGRPIEGSKLEFIALNAFIKAVELEASQTERETTERETHHVVIPRLVPQP